MKIDFKKRLRNKQFWVAVFAFVALTGKVWGLYEVPADWGVWVDLLLTVAVAGGIIINPTTDGFGD